MDVAAAGRNDLEPPARAIAPQIDAVLALLTRAGRRTGTHVGIGRDLLREFRRNGGA